MTLFSFLFLSTAICCLPKTVESLPLINNELNPQDLIIEEGETLALNCTGDEWILPKNTGYEGYSNPEINNRTFKESVNNNLLIRIFNVTSVDTGIYKCKKIKAYGWHGGHQNNDVSDINKVHVFVKGTEPNQLFLHYKNNEIKTLSIRPDQPSVIPCLVTDPNATVQLWIKGQNQSVGYNARRGFITSGDQLNGLSETEIECKARNNKGWKDTMKFLVYLLPGSHIKLTIDAEKAQNLYVNGSLVLDCSVTDIDNPEQVKFQWDIPANDEINAGLISRVTETKIIKGKTAQSRLNIFRVKTEDQGQYFCSFTYFNKENTTDVTINISQTKGQVNVDTKRYYEDGTLKFEAKMHIFPPGEDNWNNSWFHTFVDPVAGSMERKISDDSWKSIYISQPIPVATFNKGFLDGRQTVRTTANLRPNALAKADSSGNFELRVTAGGEECTQNISAKGCFHGTVSSFPLSTNSTHVTSRLSVVKLDDFNTILDPRFLHVNQQYAIVCHGGDSPTLPHVLIERCYNGKCSEMSPVETQTKDGTFERAKIAPFTPTKPKSHLKCTSRRKNQLYNSSCHTAFTESTTITLVATDVENSVKQHGMAVTKIRIPGGTDGIIGEIYEKDKLSLVCSTQKFDYSNSSWHIQLDNGTNIENPAPLEEYLVRYDESPFFSNKLIIEIHNLFPKHSGYYICTAILDGKQVERKFELNVLPFLKPKFMNGNNVEDTVEYKRKNYEINCTIAQGSPKPRLTWFKDGNPLEEGEFYDDNQRLVIPEMDAGDAGTYKCRLENRAGDVSKLITLSITGEPFLNRNSIIILCVVIGFALLIVCSLFCWQRRRERRKLQALYDNFMGTANDGKLFKLDPKKPINQQPENLPYDRRYEIPKKLVTVSEKLLGQGQFGKVYEGTYTSLDKNELPVAVKVPLHGMSSEDQKMLLDELKIMIHIGNHPNVVSLVGAITKFMVQGELYVIVELCECGQLLEYIKKRRNLFKNEIVQDLSWPYYTEPVRSVQSFASQDDEFISEIDSNQSQILLENGETNNLTTSDILSYCYQAAKGMDYLVRKTVLHRDLAARNLLLTQNQVVKVADFGLAKLEQSYQTKKSQNLMPYRWMALESIVHQQYTAKSDVWSLGVVLWELFTLGEYPYSGQDIDLVITKLKRGQRLEQPPFAPIKIYQLMHDTWLSDPHKRPTFAQCYMRIGDELEHFSKPLFEKMNHMLEGEKEKIQNYGHLMETTETSEPSISTEQSPNYYDNVKYPYGSMLDNETQAKMKESIDLELIHTVPVNELQTNADFEVSIC